MPTYDYRCLNKKCGITFEAFQSIKAKPLSKCEKCGGKAERLIGAGGGILFKGSGFYATDYKKSSAGDGKKKKEPCEPSPKDSSKCAKPGCSKD